MPMFASRQLTESRWGPWCKLGSLNRYDLYCEAFEMTRDLVTFPVLGAFAPCSDKQLKHKTKNMNTQMSRSYLGFAEGRG